MDKRKRPSRAGLESRDRSSSQEWDEANQLDDARSLSSQKSDAGYNSSGAFSDGANNAHLYHSLGSLRSSGSVGSHGSGDRYSGVHSHSKAFSSAAVAAASHIVNGETRIPTAMSYASDAQRSDAATVCSGSVVEDIEVESIVSADGPSQNVHPPPLSSVKMGGVAAGEAATSFHGPNVDNNSETVVPQKRSSSQQLKNAPDGSESSLGLLNNMGPPLSRALLLQHPPNMEGASSQAGSVKSFGSNVGSDVVAHVDTDDCGGSLDIDAHSIHSQEDTTHTEAAEAGKSTSPSTAVAGANPLLCDDESNSNGRTSPGGTIYKGRGNRRYQGRYMHLPLKRFHQNGVDLGATTQNVEVEDFGPHRDSSWPDDEKRPASPREKGRSLRDRSPRERSPREWRNGNKRARSRSRSRSRERSPDNPEAEDGRWSDHDRRKHRTRRWHSNGDATNDYRGYRSRSDRNGNKVRKESLHKGSPGRNRSRRR